MAYSREHRSQIPVILDACFGSSAAQEAAISVLQPVDMEYLLSETRCNIRLSEPAKKMLLEKIPDSTPVRDVLKFMVTVTSCMGGFGATEEGLIQRITQADPDIAIRLLDDANPFSMPIHYIAYNFLAHAQPRILEALLDKLIAKRFSLDQALLATKEKPEHLLHRITHTINKPSITRKFLELVGDDALVEIVFEDDFFRLFRYGALADDPCDFAVFERIAKSPMLLRKTAALTEEHFISALNNGHYGQESQKDIALKNMAKAMGILSYNAVSPFTLVAWAKKASAQGFVFGQVIKDMQCFIESPKKSIKEKPEEFIAFVTRHLVTHQTTLDLEKWFTLLEESINVCEQPKHKAALIMLLANALLKDAKNLVRAHRALQQLGGTKDLDAGNNFIVGKAFVMSMDSPAIFLFTLDFHAVYHAGLVHLTAAAKGGNSEAQTLLDRCAEQNDAQQECKTDTPIWHAAFTKKVAAHSEKMPFNQRKPWIDFMADKIKENILSACQQLFDAKVQELGDQATEKYHADLERIYQDELIKQKKEQLKDRSLKLRTLGWSALGEILRDFCKHNPDPETISKLATDKFQFEMHINAPEQQLKILQDMQRVIAAEIQKISPADRKALFKPALFFILGKMEKLCKDVTVKITPAVVNQAAAAI